MKKLFVLLSGVFLTTMLFGADEKAYVPKFPADVRVQQNVAYLPKDREEKADLYFPLKMAKDARLPAVVLIHGGGWSGGRRNATREIEVGSTLARNGYVAMSIDYMLMAGWKVWPTNLWDCKTAVRYLRANAEKLGVDPERIAVFGGSAGGHLAAMVALTTPEDGLDPGGPYGNFSCRVKCCVDFYGVVDLMSYGAGFKMLGTSMDKEPEKARVLRRQASPITYVRSNSVPVLIAHGTGDTTVNIEQSKSFAKQLEKMGVPHELNIIEGAPHSFDLEPKERDLRPVVLEFFKKYL